MAGVRARSGDAGDGMAGWMAPSWPRASPGNWGNASKQAGLWIGVVSLAFFSLFAALFGTLFIRALGALFLIATGVIFVLRSIRKPRESV